MRRKSPFEELAIERMEMFPSSDGATGVADLLEPVSDIFVCNVLSIQYFALRQHLFKIVHHATNLFVWCLITLFTWSFVSVHFPVGSEYGSPG